MFTGQWELLLAGFTARPSRNAARRAMLYVGETTTPPWSADGRRASRAPPRASRSARPPSPRRSPARSTRVAHHCGGARRPPTWAVALVRRDRERVRLLRVPIADR